MKKIFTLLSTVAVLGLLATSCKGKDPQPVNGVTVKSLSVAPTTLSLQVGESKTVKVGGDVKVSIEPSSASFTLVSSDKAVVSVMGKIIKAEKEGKATITVSAGDKKAKLEVEVAAARPIDETRFLANEMYIPEAMLDFKAEKDLIIRAMLSKKWIREPYGNDKEEKIAYRFAAAQGDQKFFRAVSYIHTPSGGGNYMLAQTLLDLGAWDKNIENKNSDAYGENILKIYGFTENIGRQKIGKEKDINAFVGYNPTLKIATALYHTEEMAKTPEGKEVKVDAVSMEIFRPQKKEQVGRASSLIMNLGLK